MKLALATLASVAVASEKKVPPRHPEQRLNKLRIFYNNFARDVIVPNKNQRVADRFTDRMNNFMNTMQAAFNRDNCGYYDSSSKHGGPDPEPNVNFKGKERNRRETPVDDENYVDFDEADAREFCDDFAENNKLFCCGVDKDAYAPCGTRSGSKGAKTAYDRLSTNPQLKWKQITTGTRKWAQRYINNCGGQRKQNLATKRCRRLFSVWNGKLFTQEN